jgi:hypothetical protein
MLLSVHPKSSGHPPDNFHQTNADPDMLAEILTTRVWSHVLWAGGYREEFSYVYTEYAVFDFDEGVTKEQAVELFHPYRFVLGPTKSDGKTKWTPSHGRVPACHRFRVLVPWETPIWQADVYRYNMQKAAAEFGADPQAVDAARCWQPCKSIHTVREQGDTLPVVTSLPLEHTDSHKQSEAEASMAYYKRTKTFPAYVMDILNGKTKRGDTNARLFKTCCFLLNFGFTYPEVLETLEGVPGLSGHSHFHSTLKSAARKVGAF